MNSVMIKVIILYNNVHFYVINIFLLSEYDVEIHPLSEPFLDDQLTPGPHWSMNDQMAKHFWGSNIQRSRNGAAFANVWIIILLKWQEEYVLMVIWPCLGWMRIWRFGSFLVHVRDTLACGLIYNVSHRILQTHFNVVAIEYDPWLLADNR